MKTKLFILLIVLLIPVLCFAESDVTMEWSMDPNVEITGYKLYRSEDPNTFDFSNPTLFINNAETKTAIDKGIVDGIYFWTVTAYKDHITNPDLPPTYLESEPSNIVRADLKTLLPYIPLLSIRKILKIDLVEP